MMIKRNTEMGVQSNLAELAATVMNRSMAAEEEKIPEIQEKP